MPSTNHVLEEVIASNYVVTIYKAVMVKKLGEKHTVPAAAVYIFIGAVAHTDLLAGVVVRNRVGFIHTGPHLTQNGKPPKGWTDKRSPYLLETNVPGIFAAGDVREGAVRRVASALGDGAVAVSLIHQYLETV